MYFMSIKIFAPTDLAMPLNTTQYTCLMGLKPDPVLAETCLKLLKLEA